MKHIITIALTLFLTAFAMAQERNYISTCGKTKNRYQMDRGTQG